jgi:hypothetical protein
LKSDVPNVHIRFRSGSTATTSELPVRVFHSIVIHR